MTEALSRRRLFTGAAGAVATVLGVTGCSGTDEREASVARSPYGDDPSQ